jgi:hypothetical protein
MNKYKNNKDSYCILLYYKENETLLLNLAKRYEIPFFLTLQHLRHIKDKNKSFQTLS